MGFEEVKELGAMSRTASISFPGLFRDHPTIDSLFGLITPAAKRNPPRIVR